MNNLQKKSIVNNPKLDHVPIKSDLSIYQLTPDEIKLILTLLGDTSFKVRDIEVLYIALHKLQEQYKQLIND